MNKSKVLNRNKFITDLKSLVEFSTVTGQPKGFEEAFQYIKKQFHKNAFITELKNNGETILIASNHETKKPDVCFIVHVDVVNGKTEQFSLKIDDDTAYGRGVSDMKFSIPIGYELLNTLILNKSKIKYSFVVTSDEERGGFNGAEYLADQYKLRPKVVICPDGGDNFLCINKCKGVFHARIKSKGNPAHASKPWLGENAIEPIILFASQLLLKYRDTNKINSWNTTVNIGLLNGGEIINRVPVNAFMDLDFRFIPETDSFESLQKMLETMAKKIDPKIQIEILATGEPMFTNPNNPIFQLFLTTLSKNVKNEIILQGEDGSNDARHFNKYDIPVLMSKPNGGDIHGDNEWISISSVQLYAEIIYKFIMKYEKKIYQK